MKTTIAAALAALVAVAGPAPAGLAEEKVTILYLDPSSPETSMFRVAEWPSFLFLAGAPLRTSYVSRASLVSSGYGSSSDIDCDDISASSFAVGPNDPNGFDRDGDGIGCE